MPSDNEIVIDRQQFEYLAQLVFEQSRIVLGHEKREMLSGRVAKRIKALGLEGAHDYCALLQSRERHREIPEFINTVTTNVTSFFREPHHFRHLATQALPCSIEAAKARGGERLRLWSAGCSSGQEPYSIAMSLQHNAARWWNWDVKILATDIDGAVLKKARSGAYPNEQRAAIPQTLARRFTEQAGEESFAVTSVIRRMVTFKSLNLFDDWPMNGPFDIVFCRNVAIYFDSETQRDLFGRLAEILVDGGWLYVGHSESLLSLSDRFVPAGTTLYRKVH